MVYSRANFTYGKCSFSPFVAQDVESSINFSFPYRFFELRKHLAFHNFEYTNYAIASQKTINSLKRIFF